ncbi:signal peptidase I, partial [Burkholderia pseudomallei]
MIRFVLVVVTGIAGVLDQLVFLPRRKMAADTAVAEVDRQQERGGARCAAETA